MPLKQSTARFFNIAIGKKEAAGAPKIILCNYTRKMQKQRHEPQ